jgi:hypothetical protein
VPINAVSQINDSLRCDQVRWRNPYRNFSPRCNENLAKADHHAVELAEFLHNVSQHLRAVETRCFGRVHLRTVSVFGPILTAHPGLGDLVFRHPDLDFATSHFYDAATINRPRNALDLLAAGFSKSYRGIERRVHCETGGAHPVHLNQYPWSNGHCLYLGKGRIVKNLTDRFGQ